MIFSIGSNQIPIMVDKRACKIQFNQNEFTRMVMYPTYASSEPSMNTNVESRVFSMTTLSATFPGAVREREKCSRELEEENRDSFERSMHA